MNNWLDLEAKKELKQIKSLLNSQKDEKNPARCHHLSIGWMETKQQPTDITMQQTLIHI